MIFIFAGDVITLILVALLGLTTAIIIVAIMVICFRKMSAPDTSTFGRIIFMLILMSILAFLIVANNYISDIKII